VKCILIVAISVVFSTQALCDKNGYVNEQVEKILNPQPINESGPLAAHISCVKALGGKVTENNVWPLASERSGKKGFHFVTARSIHFYEFDSSKSYDCLKKTDKDEHDDFYFKIDLDGKPPRFLTYGLPKNVQHRDNPRFHDEKVASRNLRKRDYCAIGNKESFDEESKETIRADIIRRINEQKAMFDKRETYTKPTPGSYRPNKQNYILALELCQKVADDAIKSAATAEKEKFIESKGARPLQKRRR
jgi:hypothetical protein